MWDGLYSLIFLYGGKSGEKSCGEKEIHDNAKTEKLKNNVERVFDYGEEVNLFKFCYYLLFIFCLLKENFQFILLCLTHFLKICFYLLMKMLLKINKNN
jgi:hypothetical protein